MNANEMTFGVEIEATIPAGVIAVGPHGQGLPIPQLPGWKADRDPSIRAGHGRVACEFVSPVYTGSEGLALFVRDVEAIKALGASVNRTCGLHIHVGFNKQDLPALERVTTMVANFEKAIYASTGTKNRERGGWCRGLNRYGVDRPGFGGGFGRGDVEDAGHLEEARGGADGDLAVDGDGGGHWLVCGAGRHATGTSIAVSPLTPALSRR